MGSTPCLVEDCDRTAWGRGWCQMHYMRWWSSGDPNHDPSHRRRSGPKPSDPRERFASHLSEPTATGCIEWTAVRHAKSGYGKFWLAGKTLLAHRFAYELAHGPIPDSLQIDHLCRNPPCCNPAHLEAVTAKVNVNRSSAVASAKARMAANPACGHGHAWTDENTQWVLIGGRMRRHCRECGRRWGREYRARKKAERTAT